VNADDQGVAGLDGVPADSPPPPPPPAPLVGADPSPSTDPPVSTGTPAWSAPPPWDGQPVSNPRRALRPWILVAAGVALAIFVVIAAAVLIGVRTGSDGSVVAGSSLDDSGSDRPKVPLSAQPPGSELFEDSGYTIYVDGSWSAEPQASPQTDAFWFVEFTPRFASNVNVLTEDLPFSMELDTYVDVSIRNAPKVLGSRIRELDRSEVTLANGDVGARIEWSATMQGNDLRFLQIMVVHGRAAVVVTFSALEEDFASQVGDVEPYLLTVVPTN
jgi:hypothetical protein